MALTREQLESRRAFLVHKDFLAGDERRELEGIERDLAALPPDAPTAPRVSIEALLATPDRFRAWLERQPAGQPCGKAKVCDACPLAAWLLAEGYDCWVGRSLVPSEGPTLPMPAWALAFAERLDAEGKRLVTPAEALAVLAGVAP